MARSGSDSGIQAVGEVPLGTHFCQFYRTKQDLIDTLDVCRNHQFALACRHGEWELLESSSLKIAKSELERRVSEQTAELRTALQGRDEFLVALAHDGEEALAEVARHRPEVVLLDIGLPKMDGYEVARKLRLDPENEELLLIAVTGYGNREDRERGKLSGFDHHLVKPVDLQQLQRLLASRRRVEATH